MRRAPRPIIRALALVCAIGATAVSDAGPGAGPADQGLVAPALRFDLVSALVIPADHRPRTDRLGGISGLAYDRERAEWIAVSDDHVPPRWFVCQFRPDGAALRFTPTRRVLARPPAIVEGQLRVADFEAVAVLPGGDILIASEGIRQAGRRLAASIMRFRPDGGYVADVPIPDRYLPSVKGGVERGLRDNHGFEGLGLSPDGSRLWAVAEAPLLQDDEVASARRGARSRLVEFVADGGSFRAGRELVYPIDRVPLPEGFGLSAEIVDQGVSELTVLRDGTILTMERAFVRDTPRRRSANVIRLFALDLAPAEDVSKVDSLARAGSVQPIRKTLVRDLVAIAPLLPRRLATLDNFEAMAPGPDIDGKPSLLVMSDDNFSPTQVTAAILLGTSPAPH